MGLNIKQKTHTGMLYSLAIPILNKNQKEKFSIEKFFVTTFALILMFEIM